MNDWCRLCAAGGYPVDYPIYDRYPFGLQAGSMDRNGFYANLRSVHDVALKNDVRTGTYIRDRAPVGCLPPSHCFRDSVRDVLGTGIRLQTAFLLHVVYAGQPE